MTEPLSEQIIRQIEHAEALYHRLVLVVAPAGSGKTKALQDISSRTGYRYINVNLELSRRLLDLPERQRPLAMSRLLEEIVGKDSEEAVLLDNLELLFDVSLKQDPLKCLRGLSRRRTVIASWSGSIQDGHLIYATPDHPEHHRYPTNEIMIASP